jgi:CcmD family protein
MYRKIRTLVLLFLLQLSGMPLWAQGDTSAAKPVEMADKFRADGKIYVVVAVVAVILAGLFVYVARLDRKITNLENIQGSGTKEK